MSERSISLMDFVDAPVVVGDQDGRAVYVNPAFEREFVTSCQRACGEPLANLFEGGAREAVLRAVAEVVDGAPRARLRLREGHTGYVALASPVESGEGRVGVMILLTEESPADDRLLAFQRGVLEPLDEIAQGLAEFSARTDARSAERHRAILQDCERAVARIRKWAEEVEGDLRKPPLV